MRRITGPLCDPITSALLPNARFSVATAAPFADSAASYPRTFQIVTTDVQGDFDLTLATPDTGTQAYSFQLPAADSAITLHIGSGPDTTLHALIAAQAAIVDAAPLTTHAETIASSTVLGHVKVGDGLTIDTNGLLSADGGGGAVASVNGQTGAVVLDAGDVGADASGTAAGLLSAHASLTTSAHGGIVASTDSRLSDSRSPLAHASSHASGNSDPITLAESQVTNLVADLALKAPLASPALSGTPTAPTAVGGTNTTQVATTAFVVAGFQPLDSDLTAIAALSTTAFGRALLALADASAARAAIGASAAIAYSIAISTAPLTLTDMGAALQEISNTSHRRAKVDLTNATFVRVSVRVGTAGAASAEVRAQYSTDESTWDYLDASSGPGVSISSIGTKVSSFVSLAPAAKADVFLRIITINGDGAADPVIGNIYIQVR